MRRTGAPGAGFVFVHGGCTVYQHAYGVADLATRTTADPEATVWPIASISKTVTATAAMRLVGERRLRLDRDVNAGLRRLRVPDAGFGPVTLRQLLSHAAGLDELPGRQFDGNGTPDLARFLSTRLVRYRAPGVRATYSTYAIAIAGVMIEDATGQAWADYVRDAIFLPAGMTRSRVMTTRGDEVGVATPYRLRDGRAEPMPHEWYVTAPTSSVVATVADMGRYLRLHLGDGAVDGRRIVPAVLAREMRRQQSTVHPALPGWGLGFQLDRANRIDIAEHGGDIGGFSALLGLLPAKHAGFFVVSHGEGSDLRFKVKAALLDALYPTRPHAVPVPAAKDAPLLARDYAGSYLSGFACQTCARRDDDAVFTVAANRDGTLSAWGTRWVKSGKDLFVSDDAKRLLGFSRDRRGRVDAMSGGSWRVANRLRD